MPSPLSKKRVWAGRIISAAAVLFLLFDATIKLMVIPPVVEAFTRLPGAILLTGFLGGAIVTHVRVGDPLLSHALFPVYIGALVWGGLLLRGRLAALVGELIGSPSTRPAVRGSLSPTVIHRV